MAFDGTGLAVVPRQHRFQEKRHGMAAQVTRHVSDPELAALHRRFFRPRLSRKTLSIREMFAEYRIRFEVRLPGASG